MPLSSPLAHMATIPVEKKSSTPIWLWLLPLLLLALLAFFLLNRDDDDVAETDTTTVITDDAVTATGLDLSDVWVTRVVGDNTFFVSADSAGTDETLVYIEEEATPGTATEGRYDVTPGQHVSLTGTMTPVGDTDLTQWGLTAADASAMTPESMYVRASALTMLGNAMGTDAMADGAMADGATTGDAMADGEAVAVPATGAITSADALYGTNLASLVGRSVEIDDATVLAVNGDSTFTVGSGNRRFLVALTGLGESETGPGDGSDGRFNIDAGDRVRLRGTVTAFDAANSAFRRLTAADRTATQAQGAYVNVTRRADVTKL